MKTPLVFLFAAIFATAAFAADIRAGAVMQVKTNSIWFDEAADLAKWQALKEKRRCRGAGDL